MLFYITIIISLILDILTKNIALNFLNEKIGIFWDFIYLKYFENTWIAFSMELPFIKIITIILIIWIFYYYFKEERNKKNKILDISFWLILWWAIWNWLERVLNWKVIDFIWVKYFSIFNFADIFISLGAFLYVIYILKNNK